MTYGITVEQLPDSGAPQVGITVDGLDGAAVISVEVSWDGGESWHGVRGAQRVEVVGGAFFRDHVPPLNVEARYRVVVHEGTLLPSVRYVWGGTPAESPSAEYTDGVVTRRNRSLRSRTTSVVNILQLPAAATGWGGTFPVLSFPSTVTAPSGGGRSTRATLAASATTATGDALYAPTGGQPDVSPGDVRTVSIYVRPSTTVTLVPQIQWITSGGVSAGVTTGTGVVCTANEWRRLAVTGTAPGTATKIRADLDWTSGQSLPAGFLLDVDALLIEEGAEVLPYFDGDSPGVPAPTEATITVASDTAWLQDPLNPRSAVPVHLDARVPGGVILASGALASAVWRQEADTVLPMGASLPVASIGQRVRAGDVPLRMLHDVASEGGALRRLLLSSGQLVLRGAPTPLLDPVAHIVVGDAEQTVYGSTGQVSEWDLSVQQVRPQSLRIVVPWWTYDQVRDLWAGTTYDQVGAARPGDTYLDWLRDPTVP